MMYKITIAKVRRAVAAAATVAMLAAGAVWPAPEAEASTSTLAPAADALVRSGVYASVNYGSSAELAVKKDPNPDYHRESYLAFSLATLGSGDIASAKLRVYGKLSNTDGVNVPVAAYPVADTSWSESSLTWSNKPSSSSTPLASATIADSTARWYEWDVSAYISSEGSAGRSAVSLVLKGTQSSTPYFTAHSKEAANKPQLVVELASTSPTNNLQVNAATHIGGSGTDSASAIDIGSDGSIVFAGILPGHNPGGKSPTSLLGGGDGAIVRYAEDGRSVLSVTRIGSSVTDMEIAGDGKMAVSGSFGVAVLNATASSVAWSANPGAASRVSIGSDGTVAALVSGKVHVFSSSGASVATFSVSGNYKEDLVVDGVNKSIIVTGYSQKNVSNVCLGQLQVAWMRSYSYTGTVKWTDYDFKAEEHGADQYCADTRGYRVALGKDGYLYLAGESAGGNSMFLLDPKNYTVKLGSDRLISYDAYNKAYNTAANHITWYGKYNPKDGNLILGQFLLPRNTDGSGNTIRPRGIAADANGKVYVTGTTTCCLENRSEQYISGIQTGAYAGGEAFLLIVQPDFKKRLHWTPFTKDGHSSSGVAVAVRNGKAAQASSLKTGSMVSVQAVQPNPSTVPDAYLVSWSQANE